jgi:hypothetical protein
MAMGDDRRGYLRNLVSERLPEIADDELEELMAPLGIMNQVVDLVGLLEERMCRLEGRELGVAQWLQRTSNASSRPATRLG